MRFLIISIVILMLALPISGQDATSPPHRPSSEDYLQTLVEVAPKLQDSFTYPESYTDIFRTYSSALFFLYPDPRDTEFEDLLRAYTINDLGHQELRARGYWVQRMVAAWIDEHNVDLSQVDSLAFEDFSIAVVPRDFNGDGIDEYVLDTKKGPPVDREICVEAAEVADYIVMAQAEDGYRIVETGLPWKGYPIYGRYSYSNGNIIELGFQDLNADGLPEWILLVSGETGGGPGMGYADGGGLIVLSCENDQLRYVVPSSYDPAQDRGATTTHFFAPEGLCRSAYPQTIDWDFRNTDDDAPLEILLAQDFYDNWFCDRVETKVFDWSPQSDRYVFAETQIQYAEQTQNCIQRSAEAIMWTGDYEAAIPLLERAMAADTSDRAKTPGSMGYAHSLNQYLRARLAFAYLMTDRATAAESLLQGLRSEDFEEATIQNYVDSLWIALQTEATSLEICISAYRVFAQGLLNIRVGYTGDDLYYFDNPYLPEHIGCDAPSLLRSELNERHFSTGETLPEQISDLGITIKRQLAADLNGDGSVDWLIWPDVPGVEFLFLSDGDAYQLTYTELDPFLQANDVQPIQLPSEDHETIALVADYPDIGSFTPWESNYLSFGGIGSRQSPPTCTELDGTDSTVNSLMFYVLQDEDFVRTFIAVQCGTSVEVTVPDGIAREDLALVAFGECLDEFCVQREIVPATYSWSDSAGTYLQTSPSTIPATATPSPTSTPRLYPQYWSVRDAFDAGDFEAVVGMTRAVPELTSVHEANEALGDDYLRALALEALNRDAEAVAAYTEIRDVAPESLWGLLAALHLEVRS